MTIHVKNWIAEGLNETQSVEEFLGIPSSLRNQPPPQSSQLFHNQKSVSLPPDHALVTADILVANKSYSLKKFGDAIVKFLLQGKKKSPKDQKPILWLIGGGTGAGKSELKDTLIAQDSESKDWVHTSSDAIKQLIPSYQNGLHKIACVSILSQEFAAKISVQLLNRALKRGYNVIYEAPLNDVAHPQEVIAGMPKTHALRATFATCDPLIAAHRVIQRGRETGHYIKTAYLAAAHTSFNQNLLPNIRQIRSARGDVQVFETSEKTPKLLDEQAIKKLIQERGAMKNNALIQAFRNREKNLPATVFHIPGAVKPNTFDLNPKQPTQ